MQKRQNVTIKEVAELAGVSPMTVSRFLNNHALVKEKTRQKVDQAIKQLNYRPNILARSLAGGQSLYIGLIYTNPSYAYLSEFLFGALDACRDLGHHILVDRAYNDPDLSDPEYVQRRFLETSVHAVIVAPPLSGNADIIENIEKAGIDLVCIGTRGNGKRNCVWMDDKAASEELTQHLIDLGHRKIGFIGGPSDHGLTSVLRREGFLAAMKKNGISVDTQNIQQGDFTQMSGMRAARYLLGKEARPTAIFASNDDMASGAISAAHQLDLKVPDDVSIVGFDDIPLASAIWPPLTTVRQPIRQMAASAVQVLEHKLLNSKAKFEDTKLDYSIVIRESAAPPKTR